MELNSIFYENKYSEAYDYAIKNNLFIKEIEPNEMGNRRFKIIEQPKSTQKELLQLEIEELKTKLSETDYKAIKFSEGVITLAEYEPTREQRKQWREKINILENSLKNV